MKKNERNTVVRAASAAGWFGAGIILFLLAYLVVEYLRFPVAKLRIDKEVY